MVSQQEAINGLLSLDFQNPNMWEFYFVPSTEGIDLSGIESYRITSTSIPLHHLTSHTRKTGSKHYDDWTPEGDFSITFLETTDFKITKILEEWKNQIYDPITRVFKTGENRKNGLLVLNDNKFVENLHISFYRMLFMGFALPDLNYTATDAMSITANFTADRVTIEAV